MTTLARKLSRTAAPFLLALILSATGTQLVLAEETPAGGQTGGVLSSMQKSALDTGGKEGAALSEGSLPIVIGKIINAFLALLGTVFVVLVLYAGYLWMTAGGNEEQITKAKKLISNAAIGLIIILAAYSITYFVVNAVTKGASGTP